MTKRTGCGRWLAVLLGALSAIAGPPSSAADAELAAFVDGVMQAQLAADHTVGATVAIVQDGAVLHAGGYGYANLAQQQRVDPDETLFRVASISKVLTWIAVLQQVERAGADLDEPISRYLDQVQLDNRFAAPVTLRHLMTHTPGFEDRVYGMFGDSTASVVPLVEYLKRNVPQQLFLPGSITAYSNYGTALAARVVESLAGTDYAAYVDGAILRPLGMRSTLSQVPGEDWQERLSQGYVLSGGQASRRPFEYVVPVPAGALSASAADISQLMIELLQPASSAVLSSDAKALLLGRAGPQPQALNGSTLGLFEMTLGEGERAVGHDGATMVFESRMMLWPAQQLGLFISTNTAGGGVAIEHLVEALSERYGLVQRASNAPVDADSRAVPGHYVAARREHTGRLKLVGLLRQVQVAEHANDQQLWVSGRLFQARGGGLFEEVGGHDRMHFQSVADGPDQIAFSSQPGTAFQRLAWYQRGDLTALFVALVVLLNVALLLRVPYTAFSRRSAARGRDSDSTLARGGGFAGPLGWMLALLILATLVLYLLTFSDLVTFMLSDYVRLEQLAWLWLPIAAGALLQLLLALRVWVRGRWWPMRRLFYSLVALANVVFACWMFYWNLQPLTVTGM